MRRIRACWRLLRVFLHILLGLWIAAVRLPRLQPVAQSAQVQVWSLALLGHIGIALEVRGQPPLLASRVTVVRGHTPDHRRVDDSVVNGPLHTEQGGGQVRHLAHVP